MKLIRALKTNLMQLINLIVICSKLNCLGIYPKKNNFMALKMLMFIEKTNKLISF